MPKAAKKKTPAKISGKKPRPHWRKDWKKSEKAWDDGLAVRRAMFGPAGAENQIADTTDFMWPMQDYVTRKCFGETWTRPVLNRKTRSLITLATSIASVIRLRVLRLSTGRVQVSPKHFRVT